VTIDPRTETKHRAAACRERAEQYEALAAEAKLRGDNEMSARFASSAVEERMEAQRLDDSLKP
jgi:rubrerythrin